MKLMSNNDLKEFPPVGKFSKLLGPSFIILALGLGSGEIILWPYLVSNYGLGLIWVAVLGITFQFFINMEIERYALLKGESVFVGLFKMFKWAPYWFIISTFIGFGLPGIIAASAHILATVLGIANFKWLAIGLLIAIGLILSLGKTIYGLMERLTKLIIFFGVPLIFILAVSLSKQNHWLDLFKGFWGQGNDFWFLPAGISLATLFAAFAYSGAGGNLNLTQSIYIKEKGYGMGYHSQKIVGFFRSKGHQEIKLSGEKFKIDQRSIDNFKRWWRQVNLEHLSIFWFIGVLSICLLALLAYATVFGLPSNVTGINFVINEGLIIGQKFWPILGTLFLVVVGVLLFQTQLGIFDSVSRIIAENVALKKLGGNLQGKINLSRLYFICVWALVVFGSILFLLNIYEPRSLIVLAAVLNAFSMFVHIALVNLMNFKVLPKLFQAGLIRRLIIIVAFLFFGVFSLLTLWNSIF